LQAPEALTNQTLAFPSEAGAGIARQDGDVDFPDVRDEYGKRSLGKEA